MQLDDLSGLSDSVFESYVMGNSEKKLSSITPGRLQNLILGNNTLVRMCWWWQHRCSLVLFSSPLPLQVNTDTDWFYSHHQPQMQTGSILIITAFAGKHRYRLVLFSSPTTDADWFYSHHHCLCR